MKFIYATSVICVCSSTTTRGQQVWLDYVLNYPFGNQYLLELSSSYQTNRDSDNKWRNFSITPTFEWQFFTRLDFIAEIPLAYTSQTTNYNSVGVDPTLGARYHISQNRRVTTNLVFKIEQRFLQNMETRDWGTSNRMRLRGEVFVSLNRQNLFQDRLWWSITDYEEFFVTDEQLDERYANRRRARLGIGYRHNYKNRFELIHTWQSSRDEIEGDFARIDGVIQLRYKMFLNPATPRSVIEE